MIDILVGSDETAFYKQFKTDPRSSGIKTASFLMDDGIAAAIGGQLLQRHGRLHRLLQGEPQQGQPAVRQRDEEEVRRQGRDLRRGRGRLGRRLHPRPRAQERQVDLGPDVVNALLNAKSSGPRGDLAFKNRHYVALTTYIVQEQKDGTAKLVARAQRITPIPTNPTC